MIVEYEGGGSAGLMYSLCAQTEEATTIWGTGGSIKLESPAHCPSQLSLQQWDPDDAERAGATETLTQRFPLPTVDSTGGEHYNYPNSQGLRYQIEEVEKCLAEGRIESEEYTHAEMLTNAATMQEARQQIGLLFESEVEQQPQQAQPLVEGLELWSSSERLAELAGANLVTEKEAGAKSASL